ncbi:Acyl-CoA dehydrogenase [Pyrobaculum oguniense TE7]|uniref:Acyl-CoA dehydrogenase n=1 Tax=Pyrobaculum oguniense (strain DSM 13380 / JCM 10595 / TE7) TaxID=698757 RepID=H6QAJ8_PYROT|nr:Acyl-CoA dehydrogenase [Pyrobaculum oguniense TE7]
MFSYLWLSTGKNYYRGDKPLQLFLSHLNFVGDSDLDALGGYVSTRMIEEAYYVDHYARPVLKRWSVRGEEVNYVQVSPSHLKTIYDLLKFGVVSKTITGERDLFYHFVSGYLISDAGFFCTITVTEQTAYGLAKYGNEETKALYLPNFLKNEKPWLGATFYTEVQAGSDLGGLEAVADRGTDGIWRLRGIKYFTSNVGLADAAIITAKPTPPRPGAKGVATFFAPAYRRDGSPNWMILRLKDKLGTVTVPTGEVELKDTEAVLLGSLDAGIYIALEILTIARIDNSTAGLGLARKALWEAYLYGNERRAFGKRLAEHPLYLRDLVEMEAKLQANLLLTLVAAKAFSDVAWREKPPYSQTYHYARLLTHIVKNLAAWASIDITRYSMELLGGIGFLEEFPLAKIHRDALVTAIWEGTSNIQSLDMVEVFYRKNGGKAFIEEVSSRINNLRDGEARHILSAALDNVKDLSRRALEDGVELHSKKLLSAVGKTAAATYYQEWAEELGEGWALALSKIYLYTEIAGKEIDSNLVKKGAEGLYWMS